MSLLHGTPYGLTECLTNKSLYRSSIYLNPDSLDKEASLVSEVSLRDVDRSLEREVSLALVPSLPYTDESLLLLSVP